MIQQYKVSISRYAYAQMQNIKNYIEIDLASPTAARNIMESFRSEIGKLNYLPERHPLVDEEPWQGEGVRRLIFKNYIIYYWIDAGKFEVTVLAVVFGKRDQLGQLGNIPALHD